MSFQKYVFALLTVLFSGVDAFAQCLVLPNALEQQFQQADKILEGRVTEQTSFVGQDGNIYTTNHIEVYRVFKGDVGFNEDVITNGGVYGELMQIVTPSIQLHVGDYGVLALRVDETRSLASFASTFHAVDEKSGRVYGLKHIANRAHLYEFVARHTGSETTELRRIPVDLLEEGTSANRTVPQLTSVYPLEVTAGTQTVLTISGLGFGNEQGSGHVAFRNADDGGQSFVALQPGPHYLSWSDTEIQIYVPSATLYNNVVAGTGLIQVRASNGQVVTSSQQVTVDFAKSEVVYNENLNNTMLTGMQNGGYLFHANQEMTDRLNGTEIVNELLAKWSCNTGVNYQLSEETVTITDWVHDGVNLIGMSNPGQLPNYMLGRTITTFSGCGSAGDLQWNLIEVDILLNSDIDWCMDTNEPTGDQFDLETSLLHELGHAHLLQHNNEEESPMYFQLTAGTARRDLHAHSDIEGGDFIVQEALSAATTCGEELHQSFDYSTCNLSVINSLEETSRNAFSVYPNPFETEFVVQGDWSNETYTVYDATGRTVLTGVLMSSQHIISAPNLQRGFYVLEISIESERYTRRIVKN